MRITLQDVFYTYNMTAPDGADAHINGISLELDTRETIGLIGPNGAGKTTLLHLITGLEKPDGGSIRVDGRDIHDRGYDLYRHRSRIGLVFQSPELQLFERTVAEDIAFGPHNQGVSEAQIRERVIAGLQAVGLDAQVFSAKSIYELSEGEKRRVAIAGILAMEPEFTLFDEPTAGLDHSGRRHIAAILHKHRDRDQGYLVASHDMELLLETVDRFILLERGRVVADFARDAFEQYARRFPHLIEPTRSMRLAERLRALGLSLHRKGWTHNELLADLTQKSAPKKK